MPFRTERTHRQSFDVLRDIHFSKGADRIFDSTYLTENAYGEKYIYPGLVIAVCTGTSKFVPYSAGASYGLGSDTAVGVTHILYNMTYGDKIVSGIWHGTLREDYCYVYGGALGTIAAGIKTALDDIQWI